MIWRHVASNFLTLLIVLLIAAAAAGGFANSSALGTRA